MRLPNIKWYLVVTFSRPRSAVTWHKVQASRHFALCTLQTVVLDSSVDPESAANKGNVERWLLELEAMQWQSVRTQVTLSLQEYPTIPREQWVLNWPAQAVLGVSQVRVASPSCVFIVEPVELAVSFIRARLFDSWRRQPPLRSDEIEYVVRLG